MGKVGVISAAGREKKVSPGHDDFVGRVNRGGQTLVR